MKRVEIYTDGSCKGNPGPGGWAAVLIYNGHISEIAGAAPKTTNQQMELTAAIKALEKLKEPCQVNLYSDSAYLINAFRQNWLTNWERNGWMNSRREPVSNQELWQQLLKLSRWHQVNWIKVKGHSDNRWNNRCDELARQAVEELNLHK